MVADAGRSPGARNAFVELARGTPEAGAWPLPADACAQASPSHAHTRLLCSRPVVQYADRGPLLQALLATSVTMFQFEALRASCRAGALTSMSVIRHHLHLPDWRRLPLAVQERITHAYQPLARREPLPAAEEFRRGDRLAFELAVWSAFGVAERVPAALLDLIERIHARDSAS